jgi:hypothetical protein
MTSGSLTLAARMRYTVVHKILTRWLCIERTLNSQQKDQRFTDVSSQDEVKFTKYSLDGSLYRDAQPSAKRSVRGELKKKCCALGPQPDLRLFAEFFHGSHYSNNEQVGLI